MSLLLAGTALLAWHPVAAAADPSGVHWPSFRGPHASGIAEGFPTPTVWDAATWKNIKWKTPIPGLGHSGAVIWGQRVFVTTAISGRPDAGLRVGLYGDIASVQDDTVHRWEVYCLNKDTGAVLWKRVAHQAVPQIRRHTKSTHANSTPATNGRYVVAFFGSEGLYCYDVDGTLRWKKDLGLLDSGYYAVPTAQWEFGSSPTIFQDMVIVQCDVQRGSFLAALRLADGSEVWRTRRDEVPTWSTPTIDGARARIYVNGYKHIGGYELGTGKPVWRLRGGGDIPVPTPVVAHDLVFITNAHGGPAPIFAVRADATGDLGDGSGAGMGWKVERGGAYMQTPLVYGDYLYSCKGNGVLSCLEAKTGRLQYRQRLAGGGTGFTASPVAANDKIYFTGEDGHTIVVAAGPEYRSLATNRLGEVCMATPAISEGVLFFRAQSHLYAIATATPPPPAGK